MTRLVAALLAILCLAFSAPPARATTPAGDWVGALRMPGHTYALGLRVRQTPAGYRASYDWINLELRNIPLTPISGTPVPAFERKAIAGVFMAQWVPAEGWRGEWRRAGHVYPIIFRPGVLPPAPVISRVDSITLAVLVMVMVLEAGAIVWLLRLRSRRWLRTAAA
jgi:hypothetical protein